MCFPNEMSMGTLGFCFQQAELSHRTDHFFGSCAKTDAPYKSISAHFTFHHNSKGPLSSRSRASINENDITGFQVNRALVPLLLGVNHW